jgi:hypothetical protein
MNPLLTKLATITSTGLALCALSAHSAVAASSDTTRRVTLPPELRAIVVAQTPPAGPIVTFAGKVPGTNAYLSVVSRGGQIEAYVCDGEKTAVWLKGTTAGSTVSARDSTGNVLFSAKRTGSTLTGSLTLSGKRFDIRQAQVSYPAGLWKSFGLSGTNSVTAGWVVLPDGTQRGAKLVGGTPSTIGSLDPGSVGSDIDGDGATNVAVPSTPVAFKKAKAVATTAPTLGAQCASLMITFTFNMDNFNNPNITGAAHTASGNAATQAYQQGQALGCIFAT